MLPPRWYVEQQYLLIYFHPGPPVVPAFASYDVGVSAGVGGRWVSAFARDDVGASAGASGVKLVQCWRGYAGTFWLVVV